MAPNERHDGYLPDGVKVVHVYPNYGPEHQTEIEVDADCWCSPTREPVFGSDGVQRGLLIVHRELN